MAELIAQLRRRAAQEGAREVEIRAVTVGELHLSVDEIRNACLDSARPGTFRGNQSPNSRLNEGPLNRGEEGRSIARRGSCLSHCRAPREPGDGDGCRRRARTEEKSAPVQQKATCHIIVPRGTGGSKFCCRSVIRCMPASRSCISGRGESLRRSPHPALVKR